MVRAEHQVSIRRACRVVGISCSVYRYQPDAHRDDEVIAVLQLAVEGIQLTILASYTKSFGVGVMCCAISACTESIGRLG